MTGGMNDVNMNFDGLDNAPHEGTFAVQSGTFSEFDRNGFRVVEASVPNSGANLSRLLWCRAPFEDTVVDGKWANPLFWKDHLLGDSVAEAEARGCIRTAFDDWWKAPKTMDQMIAKAYRTSSVKPNKSWTTTPIVHEESANG